MVFLCLLPFIAAVTASCGGSGSGAHGSIIGIVGRHRFRWFRPRDDFC